MTTLPARTGVGGGPVGWMFPMRQAGTTFFDRQPPKQKGWNLTYHVFDYNMEFFEIGAG